MKVCSDCRRCYDDAELNCADRDHRSLIETAGSPEMVPGYRLEQLLSSGASGDTYRAKQAASGQTCRIKVVSAGPGREDRFLSEAQTGAAFFHPNVVDIYEAGQLEAGNIFVVSEDADGQTLRDFVGTTHSGDLLTSVCVARQIAEGLHALHLKGLAHGAVDPENIILSTDDEGRLLARIKDVDFGSVTARSIISNKSMIDSAVSSLRYFAPEQCDGQAADMKTDIYGLGIVLFEMLAGVPPFDASKAVGLIEMHKHQQPPEIKIDNFDLRMLVTHTLTESLQKQPRLRQSSANAFARQLRHIEQLATHVSTPPPAGIVPSLPVRYAIPVKTAAVLSPDCTDVQPGTREESKPAPAPIDIAASQFKPVPAARPSRLKLHRKRLHSWTVAKGSTGSDVRVAETALAEPIRKRSAEIAVAHSQSERKTADKPVKAAAKVEWQQPDDDVPTMADVLEVLSKETASPVESALAVHDRVNNRVDQNVAELARPEPDRPVVDRQAKAKAATSRAQMPKPPLPTASLPEEITIVTARKDRITIPIDRPRPTQKPAAERRREDPALYMPTLLGNDRRILASPDTDVQLFSAYGGSPAFDSALARRSATIGAALVFLATVFYFSGEYLTSNTHAGKETETAASAITSIEQPLTPNAQPSSTETSKIATAAPFEPPQTKPETERGRPAASIDEKNALPLDAVQRRSISKGDHNRLSTTTSRSQNVRTTEPIASTLVISTENGRTKQTIQTRSARGADAMTRPRIVQNVRPQ